MLIVIATTISVILNVTTLTDWIVDHTRRGYHTPTYGSRAEYLEHVARFYRGNLWAQADYYCEVRAESRSIAGVLQADCEDLAVSLYPTGGFSSLTLAYEAAQQIEALAGDKPLVILYVGNYDPAGVLIDVALEKELRTHLPGHINLNFRRLAVTPEQIAEYDLPGKPRKEGDRRALHIQETVEAEAMPAAILRDLVRGEVEALLPPRALEIAKLAGVRGAQVAFVMARFAEIFENIGLEQPPLWTRPPAKRATILKARRKHLLRELRELERAKKVAAQEGPAAVESTN